MCLPLRTPFSFQRRPTVLATFWTPEEPAPFREQRIAFNRPSNYRVSDIIHLISALPRHYKATVKSGSLSLSLQEDLLDVIFNSKVNMTTFCAEGKHLLHFVFESMQLVAFKSAGLPQLASHMNPRL